VAPPEPELAALARLWDIQASYVDLDRRRHRASRESLLSILMALGAPLPSESATAAEVAAALADRRRQRWTRKAEPVTVAWGGWLGSLPLRLPAAGASGLLAVRLDLEGGEVRTAREDLDAARVRDRAEIDGQPYVRLEVGLRQRVPLGYHRLSVSAGPHEARSLVIAAPREAFSLGGGDAPRMWGVFGPLYAVHSETSLGIGDFRDLGELQEWVGGLGGRLVATLPLFATFLDEPFEPSPYSPVSRRFWSEAFVDVAALPELEVSPGARAALAEEARLLEDARRAPLVDYRRVAAAKRRVLGAAAQSLFGGPSARRDQLECFAAGHPALEDYATFRAACDTFRAPWQEWPGEARAGRLSAGEAPAAARDYHRYVQWIAERQLEAAGGAGGAGLLLDLPLGVHPGGYDVWRERGAFLPMATAGAPPDPLNAKGQDWGNPPLHPEGIREGGYAYPIACIRRLMSHSRILRVDHVMGLHRLFVLPPGRDARDGVYIRYRADENYAILCLESQRAGTVVVGEDLGTVPAYCRSAMAAHKVLRSYVGQWGITPAGLAPVPPDAVASINTHDMAPFAAFWRGIDIEERQALGLLTDEQARHGREERARQRQLLAKSLVAEGLLRPGVDADALGGEHDVLVAWVAFLARSAAAAVLVALEDLWGETASQNLPGTVTEHPNWRRRLRWPQEAIRSLPEVVGRLELLNDLRRRAGTAKETT